MSDNSVNKAVLPSLLNEQQFNAITQAISGLNSQQLTWVSGYLAGLSVSGAPIAGTTGAAASSSTPTLTILYGSQTGNAKALAQQFKVKADAAGYTNKLVSMADFKPRQIKSETHLVVFVSTHGEGDAPDDAMELHEFLGGKKAPKLSSLNYAVLSLGDSSYEFFCQTGKDFDSRLAALGANAICERADCDVDYEEQASTWSDELIASLKEALTIDGNPSTTAMPAASSTLSTASNFNKNNPFTASLIESQKITGRYSVKDIRHIEISLEDSGLTYQPGDALGVWFTNAPALVDEFISLLSLNGDSQVSVKGESMTLRKALSEKLELTLSYPGFVKAYQEHVNSSALQSLMDDPATFRTYLSERQLVDVVREHPGTLEPQQLVDALRPLSPRLYSIASSQAEVEEEVHLTVAHVDYMAFGQRHQGGASGFLSERLEEGQEVKVFVENNNHFKLPENDDTPIIMVGPGTGIAPFRAFMQERDARGASGKNWLFFGNPHFTQDFLYQVEWQGYKKSGLLTNITLAFSRDQKEKVYVQHRLMEQGKEVFQWLEAGAHFYVCGDAMHMAKDVEGALLHIVEKFGNKSEQEAKEYVLALRKAKRYQKDVY
ncbi:assimilatory sulfite reductase (NADPH) flavoprotein subunit [Alteromonas sp. ASW11-130]|uniref:assimilatory sulfite reductase (NADPH) flavoprotein subunit n=1 Tax=Alteromonas sp. ASW11-130 TaxID=3015775 RepID=UPI002241E3CA|nr:assimilatory sulfite reductase (NADPH) flavoprotein subunit [Alteromonas sp. ASW11-130]MCW8092694.1 assimilatory sulfite reductase (NADPH) flavoprotein subunit [Alteromonas sp. ASW11-130]